MIFGRRRCSHGAETMVMEGGANDKFMCIDDLLM
uniref:Uncharacterized protein n=1 Tax=Arundo donax TaxID=35708 RepID=A0A0A9A6X5_ARUDO